jgi:hypothetical protein
LHRPVELARLLGTWQLPVKGTLAFPIRDETHSDVTQGPVVHVRGEGRDSGYQGLGGLEEAMVGGKSRPERV